MCVRVLRELLNLCQTEGPSLSWINRTYTISTWAIISYPAWLKNGSNPLTGIREEEWVSYCPISTPLSKTHSFTVILSTAQRSRRI